MNESVDYNEVSGFYYRLEEERQREMGIEWPDDHELGYAGVLEAYYNRLALAQARTAQRRLDEMERIDWGLLDEFLVLGRSGSGLWLQHSACRKPTGMARTNLSVADLVLAVEEHMKECGK